MREAHCKKRKHFCNVHVSSGNKQIRESTCFKQHAFWVNPLGVLYVFRIYKIPFLSPKREPNHEKIHLGSPFLELGTPKSERAHSDQKKVGPKGGPFRVLDGAQRLRATLYIARSVCCVKLSSSFEQSTEQCFDVIDGSDDRVSMFMHRCNCHVMYVSFVAVEKVRQS